MRRYSRVNQLFLGVLLILEASSCTKVIDIDGNLGEWPQGYFLQSLTAPWDPLPQDSTRFQTLVAGDYLYFYFQTLDSTPFTIPFDNELSVAAGDRVELFFSKTRDMSGNYYCIEMNPRGEVLDYRASYYREFDYDWNASTLELGTKELDTGYQVEGKLSINELEELGFGNEFYLGIYRADYKGKDQVIWYSWIIPESETPDFHIPSSLSKVKFAEDGIERSQHNQDDPGKNYE